MEQQQLKEPQQLQEYAPRPTLEPEHQVFEAPDLMTIDQCETVRETSDSQLLGAPATVSGDSQLVGAPATVSCDSQLVGVLATVSGDLRLVGAPATVSGDSQDLGAPATVSGDSRLVGARDNVSGDSQLVEGPATASGAANGVDLSLLVDAAFGNEAGVSEVSVGKRRRGRPPRSQGKTAAAATPGRPPQRKEEEEEEDVCFICFDGGSLVLCDRRGCPKAYHPACIKRDEAFFRSKAKWNCGWHICSRCQKTSYYVCYTCTFSLCKRCTKDADYVCVRGNKGFCGTCMKTIMLIENIALGNKEMVQVDFDDKTSWEYLFKIYWICLKEKLSLTLDELTKAKNPWQVDGIPKAKNSWKGSGTIVPKVKSLVGPYHGHDEKSACLDNFFGEQEASHSKRRKTMNHLSLLYEVNSINKSGINKVTTLPGGMVWATKELLEFVAHMKNGDTSVLTQFDVQALLLEYIKRNNLRDPHQKSHIVCDSRLINLFGKDRLGHVEMLKLLEYHFLIKEKSSGDDAVVAGVSDAVDVQVEAIGDIESQLMMDNDRRHKTCKTNDDRRTTINPSPDEYAAIDLHNINLLYLKRSLMENLMDNAEKFHEKVVGSFVRIRISGGDQNQDTYRLVLVVGTSKVIQSYKVGTRTTDVMLEILNLDRKELVSIGEISNQDFSEDECRCLRQSIKCGLIKRLTVGEIQRKAMAFRAVKVSDWLEAEIIRLNHLRDQASERGHSKELRECVEKLELLKLPMERQHQLLEIPIVHADPKMDPSYESEKDDGELDEKKKVGHVGGRNYGDHRNRPEIDSPLQGGDFLNDMANRAHNNQPSENMSATFYVDRGGTTQIRERMNDSACSKGETFAISGQDTSKSQASPAGLLSGDWNSLMSVLHPTLSIGRELSVNEIESDTLWHYQDPNGKIQGPFSMMQLCKWSISGHFPLDLRVWRVNEKRESAILLTDVLGGWPSKESLLSSNRYSVLPEIMGASNRDNKWEHELSKNTGGNWEDSKKYDDARIHRNDTDELLKRIGLASDSPCPTTAVDVAVASDGQARSSTQGWELSNGSKPGTDQAHMCNSFSSHLLSGKLFIDSLFQVNEGNRDEKCSHASNINGDLHKVNGGEISATKSDEKQGDSEVHSSQSSGQNWRPPPIDSSSSGWDSKCCVVSVAKPAETSKQNRGIDFSDFPDPTPRQIHGYLQGQAAGNKQSVSSSVPIQDSGLNWSTTTSLVVSGAQVPEVGGEWGRYSSAPARPPVSEWDSNLVSASSLKPSEGVSDHAATPTSGSCQPTHSSQTHPAIDVSSWQAMVAEPNEFCSLADESVSDLLAEIEAMESLGGLPSPTSRLTCGGELAQGSDNDCFSPVEGFNPLPDHGKSDALSSTGDVRMPSQLTVAEEHLQATNFHSKLVRTDTQLGPSQLPSQLSVTEEHLRVSHMPSQSKVTAEPLGASQMPTQSTLTDEPLKLPQDEVLDSLKIAADILDSLKRFSAHSSPVAEVEGDAKHSDVSVNQWEAKSETRPPVSSTTNQGEAGSDIKPPMPSAVRQQEADSDVQHPAPSEPESNRGTVKGNANLSRAKVTQVSTDTVWGTGHGTVQQNTNTHSTTSTGNSSNWGSQSRHGGDRLSGSRDHRSYYHGRDSGYGRDRSMWNRQASFGAGNGGGNHRPPPKGLRVCKFYENGYCRKGSSCSYWHPHP